MNRPVLSVLYAGMLLALAGCENNLAEVQAIQQKELMVETAKQVRIIYSQSAKVRAIITAPHLIHYTNAPSKVVLDQGLLARFFDDSLHLKSTLTARYGEYFEQTGKIEVRDSVVVVNAKGEKLNCDELHWDLNKKLFVSNSQVRITTPSQLIYGKGLEAPSDFSWYLVTQVQNSRIRVPKSQLGP